MDLLRQEFIGLFMRMNISELLAEIFTDVILLGVLILVGVVLYYLVRLIYNKTLRKLGEKSRNILISEFFKNPLTITILKLIPIIIISKQSQALTTIYGITDIAFTILIAFMIVKVINSFLDLVNAIYEKHNKDAGVKPIKGLINFGKAIVFTVVFIIVISNLIGQSPIAILTGLGALSAVLLLVFKDTILGLVAGFQMSANDLIRIGDWIEMPKYGVDGDVVDVTLTFIKVQNWDKTIVTIPAYLLVSDSFTNWSNVFKLGGRRIKRSVNIDTESVKVVDDELYKKLVKIDLIKDYLKDKKIEIDKHNKDQQVDTSVELNGRRLTNLGVFRIYITEYLKKNPNIHQEMLLIVRQLQYENKGIPLEIYAFSSNTAWVMYEGIQADIFDHIYANIGYFDLRIYQEPSGHDFKETFVK